jgi:hypothetical protein
MILLTCPEDSSQSKAGGMYVLAIVSQERLLLKPHTRTYALYPLGVPMNCSLYEPKAIMYLSGSRGSSLSSAAEIMAVSGKTEDMSVVGIAGRC